MLSSFLPLVLLTVSVDVQAAGEGGAADASAVDAEAAADSASEEIVPAEPVVPFVEPEASKEILAFADHLFLDGDWYRSISEYRRYLYSVKGRGEGAPRAAIAIGEALLRGEQYDAAARQLDGVAQRTSDNSLRNTALFGSARAYLLDGRPEFAKPRFRLISEDVEAEMNLREESTWLLAWGHFDAGELDMAKELFVAIGAGGGRHAEAAKGVAEAIDQKDNLPTKNILLAGALSLIPGLGHFYLGQWGIGVTSLGWNGLFIVACVLAWVQGQWGPAIVLTLLELGWYAGGIFGAISGAYRHNRDAVRNWRDRILADYGETRELPIMSVFDGRHDARPGSLVRLGGSF
jgi:TM2 domain-containing membrane protein YozV